MFVYRIKTYEKDKQQVLFVAGKEAALIKARKLSYDMRDVLVSVEEIRISKIFIAYSTRGSSHTERTRLDRDLQRTPSAMQRQEDPVV